MITVTASGGQFVESTGYKNVTISLSEPATTRISIPWSVSGATAAAGDDYADTRSTLTFNAGETSKQVRIYTYADDVAEGDEAATLTIYPALNAAVADGLTRYDVPIWIQDDDAGDVAPSLWVSSPVVEEGDSGVTTVRYRLNLSQIAEQDHEIEYRLVGDSAEAGEDFVAATGTAVIARGTSEAFVSVQVSGDQVAEGVEYANLELDLPDAIAESTGGQMTIVDDDHEGARPVVLASSDVFGESTGYKYFAVSLSEPTTSTVTVPWSFSGGTATAGVDYAAGGSTIRFDPGETLQHVRVYTYADDEVEADESIQLVLGAPASGAILPGGVGQSQTVGWVEDDDAAAAPLALWVSSPQAVEGDGGTSTLDFDFELSRPAPTDLEIRYIALDGSAEGGEDFEGASGTVTILRGQRSATAGVEVTGDTKYEPGSESFNLRLFLPPEIAETFGGVATILEDDAATDPWRQDGDEGADRIRGYEHVDHIRGEAGDDRLWGYDGDDRLDGGAGDDVARGGAGDDALFGRAGADVLHGNGGLDRLVGGGGNDRLNGGAGGDRLIGGGGNDRLNGGGGNDRLDGGGGADTLIGGGGEDQLDGGNGRDTLSGGGGGDLIEGGRGADELRGGGGRDQFVFGARDGRDTILDFRDDFDVIVIEAGANRFSQVDVLNRGDDVVIRFADTTIRLLNEDHRDIDAGDFIFA